MYIQNACCRYPMLVVGTGKKFPNCFFTVRIRKNRSSDEFKYVSNYLWTVNCNAICYFGIFVNGKILTMQI